MTAPNPDEESSALRRLIREGARVRPLSERERDALLLQMRQQLEQRGGPESPARRLALGVACTALVGLTLFSLDSGKTPGDSAPVPGTTPSASAVRVAPAADAATAPAKDTARRVSLGGRGEIVLAGGAIARLPTAVQTHAAGPLELALDSGQLTANVAPRGRDEPLSIVTPQVAVIVIGTRFSVSVADGVTTVQVAYGRVRVDRGGQSLFVDGGEMLRSDDARFSSVAAPSAADRALAQCDDGRQRRRCLRRIAHGTDLAAENALFSLALLDDERGKHDAALTHLRHYERRFPRGLLRQEVALTVVRIHRALGREAEACALVEQYAHTFGDEPAIRARLRAGCASSSATRPRDGESQAR